MTSADVLADLPPGDLIPLPWVCQRVGWNRSNQHHAVASGVVTPVAKRGKAGCYQVTRAEAIEIMMAAVVAIAAGVAVVVMLRAFRSAGISAAALVGAMTG